jgi:MFS family permease
MVTESVADETQGEARAKRGFAALWGSAVVSSVGDGAYVVAAPLLAAFLTRDPLGVAVVSAAAAAPWFLVGFWAGVIVDRFPRRTVLAISELVRAIGLALLGVLVVIDHATIPLLAATSFLVVTGQCFSDPAAQALVPHVVGRSEALLTKANGRLYSGETVGRTLVGPPVGGLTYSVAPWAPFALDAASFAISAALVARIAPTPSPEAARERGIAGAVREGFVYLLRDRGLVLLAFTSAAYNVTHNMAAATLVLFVTTDLGLTDFGFGLLIAAGAVGAIVAGWISSSFLRVLTLKGAVIVSCLAQGAAWLLAGSTSSPLIAGAAFVVLGATSTLVTVAVVSARQQLVPDHLLGRVVSAFRLIGNGAAPLGSLLGGVIAAAVGLRAPMLVAAAFAAFTTAVLGPLLFRRSR